MSRDATPSRVLRQRAWTEAELRAARFRLYQPRKRLVMARVVRQTQRIDISLETLVARSGSVICYDPGDTVQPSLDDYEHWPVQRELFLATYTQWDEVPYQPTPPEAHLMRLGCRPYYKHQGVWAMRLRKPIYVQSMESPQPVLVPAGRWLCIGREGEPYHMSEDSFSERYLL
jgi:hypothetical protein